MSDIEKALQIKQHQLHHNHNELDDDGQDADADADGDGDNDDEATTMAVSHTGLKNSRTRGAAGHTSISRTRRCLGQLLKLVLSTPGLVLLVIGYSIMGALIFPLLEAPQDLSKSAAIAKSREDCLRELWIITEKLNVLYERNWTMLVHEQLRRFEGSIVAATRQGAGVGGAGPGGALSGGGSASALGHFGYDSSTLDPQSWTFSEALLYSVTVITTIGHGSLTPRTAAGKLATIFYALIGVPLMLMCLSSLGSLLAEGLQCTYVKLCCQLQKRSVKSATPAIAAAAAGGISSSTSSEVATTATTKRRHATKGGTPTAGNGANCKNCKYDAAKCNETSLNNECYEYGSMMTKRRLSLQEQNEDACQLLRKQQQHHHQQQQQQQQQFYHQQQPDVMLMTTTTTGNALLKYAPQQQQQQQQQLTTATLPRQHHHQQQQQNFVAVPTSLLRFSAAPTMPVPAGSATAVAPPPLPPLSSSSNCYGPATATIYFPFAPSSSSALATATAAAAAATHTPGGNCPQPLVKYHTIHLQPAASNKHQHRLLTSTATATESAAAAMATTTGTATTSTLEAITLPPPPAYQTSNMHTMRRAKFVTNPLPHEINALLLAGGSVSGLGLGDLSCRHDLLPTATGNSNINSGTATTATYTPPLAAAAATSPQLSSGIKATAVGAAATGGSVGVATTTMSDNSFIAAGVCGNVAPPATTTSACTTTPAAAAAATLSALLSSNSTVGNVDIMEDEDEQERERMSNCPHGTPSRVPLIAANSQQLSLTQQQQQQQQHDFNELKSGNQSRHASSLHRHTIMQAGGLNRKTLLLTRRCQRHATAALYDATATNTETSDDEEYMQHGSSEQFVLKKLKRHRISESDDGELDGGHANKHHDDDDDDYSDDDDEDASAERQQVPISLVLLILMCYICVGTVIFALWENWSLVDGAYFCFVTLSTIGYGDFAPTRSFNGPELQLYACCAYLLLGLVLVAMSFSILETQLMWKCRRIAVRLKLTKSE
ncbi:AF4/FMR2 family member lilli [Drosophila tropicalis]|uniref:AF4/FMR2 family member lilli n=1 Tax=Drosophila tropicalis TaxID=46794 RepID=UPI0035ABCEB0